MHSAQSVPLPLIACLDAGDARGAPKSSARRLIGVLEGNGIGPEVVRAALAVLDAVASLGGAEFDLEFGGPIGETAEQTLGTALPETVVEFCEDVFRRGGAILSGAGGGRYVYDLRRRFDLYCKVVPIRPWEELRGSGCLRPRHLQDVDILLVRDNSGGVYQGTWSECLGREGRVAKHAFAYTESQVRRLTRVAARAASGRGGHMTVVVKEGGIPSMTRLWRDVVADVAAGCGVEVRAVNIDLAAYEIIQQPRSFDVILAPNLFGDILADLGGVLVGSRGLTYSGNFSGDGKAVYQTNHGSAHDLAGSNRANPVAQILSLAMLLRESFQLADEANAIESAVAAAWRAGWRTADIAEPGCRTIGGREMTCRIVEELERVPRECRAA